MSILIFSIFLFVFSVLALGASLKLLLQLGWFLKWLRGTGGVCLLFVVIFSFALGYELLGFNKADDGQVIATLTFDKNSHQDFSVELVDGFNNIDKYNLLGDQWQLDVKLVSLSGLGEVGLPSYKLDRISGRYLTLEQEKLDERTVYELFEKKTVGIWQTLHEHKWLPFLKANYGSAAFMPMADGAIYQVKLFKKGLRALPVNDKAKMATDNW